MNGFPLHLIHLFYWLWEHHKHNDQSFDQIPVSKIMCFFTIVCPEQKQTIHPYVHKSLHAVYELSSHYVQLHKASFSCSGNVGYTKSFYESVHQNNSLHYCIVFALATDPLLVSYIKMHGSMSWGPKKWGVHKRSECIDRNNKVQFSRIRSSVMFYPNGTKFTVKLASM